MLSKLQLHLPVFHHFLYSFAYTGQIEIDYGTLSIILIPVELKHMQS